MAALSAAALNKLAKEVKELQQQPIDGVKVGSGGEVGVWGGRQGCQERRLAAARWRRLTRLAAHLAPGAPQVLLNEDNLADIQAEYDGPGAPHSSLLLRRSVNAALPPRAATRRASRRGAPPPRPRAAPAAGTPFESGLFRMKLVFGAEYPTAPPKGARRSSR